MPEATSGLRSFEASTRAAPRLLATLWRQRARSLLCPDTPSLDGQLALVTGGSEGIGLGTCRGLLRRGARVVIAARSPEKAERALAELRAELGAAAPVSFLPLDLSDLDRVVQATKQLAGQTLDLLVCNAGLWPRRHAVSAQGHELAFATNVLGHHLLVRRLASGSLASGARVVILTGDIYILADDCTPDYDFRTPRGGMLAYCRSKLGNLWLAGELQRRQPELDVRIAHPGVVSTGLVGARGGVSEWLSRRMLLDADAGAQTTLYCATQPGLPKGAYLHNTAGRMQLRPEDPACDTARAAVLWDRCEALCAGRLPE